MNFRKLHATLFFLAATLSGCMAMGKASSEEKQVVCFVYHRFGDSRYPSTNTTLADFEAHLKYLKNNGYQVLTLEQAADYLHSDDPAKKTAVITIDDGYESFYKNGLALLEKYRFPATLFINTETVGAADYMNWSQLKDVARRGIEIGNHTHSHAYFLNLPESTRYLTFEEEINQCQQLIREHLELTPVTFAYPYGELDEKMETIVKKAGFKAAAAQNSGVLYTGSDLLRIPRFPMSEHYSAPEQFASKACMQPLHVTNEFPISFMIPKGTSQPELSFEMAYDEAQTATLQVFIQGSTGTLTKVDTGNGTVKITITPQSAISGRRRTLYTITGQDKNGNWHWFSHLWINPAVK